MKIIHLILPFVTTITGLAETNVQPNVWITKGEIYPLYVLTKLTYPSQIAKEYQDNSTLLSDVVSKQGCRLRRRFWRPQIIPSSRSSNYVTSWKRSSNAFHGCFTSAKIERISSDACVTGVYHAHEQDQQKQRKSGHGFISRIMPRANQHVPESTKPSEGIIRTKALTWNQLMITAKDKKDYFRRRWHDQTFEEVVEAGKGVDIYVIDTGVNVNLTDFGDRAQYFETPVGNPDYNTSHGTCIASVAAGAAFGVAPAANVLAIELPDIIDYVSAVYKIIERHNTKKQQRHRYPEWRGSVILTALGYGNPPSNRSAWAQYEPFQERLIQVHKAADEAGIVTVSTAGNRDVDVITYTPLNMLCMGPGVICVGSVNESFVKSEDSNFGPAVSLWAPGTDIACRNNTGVAVLVAGTSVAAPHVAGVVATILSHGQSYSRHLVGNTFLVKLALFGNAKSGILDLGDPVRNRNLLVNTGIHERRYFRSYASIQNTWEAIKKEDLSPFMAHPTVSPTKVKCYSDEPRKLIGMIPAQKLWLRLRWELGHSNIYETPGVYQEVVPCIDGACVYYHKDGKPFTEPPHILYDVPYLDKYVKHIIVECQTRGYTKMTGGSMELPTENGISVHLRRDITAPIIADFSRGVGADYVPSSGGFAKV